MTQMEYIRWQDQLKSLPKVCLIALTVYAEGRGEPRDGKIQIAWVAKRREINKLQWDDILDAWQFSCFNFPANETDRKNVETIRGVRLFDPIFQECLHIAEGVLNGSIFEPLPGATHYHNPRIVTPKHIKAMKFLGVIGNHEFYSDKPALEA